MKYLSNPRTYLVIIFIAFILHSLHFNFVCDDAFISFRYAKNFINGHGLVWNIGERPVEGYTNFLWVIIISFFMKMGFEPETVSRGLGVFCGLCCIFLTYLFSELIFRRKSLLNLIAPVILACCGPFAAWSTGGLETQLFTLLILAAVSAYLYEIEHNHIPLSAILFALASLTRPEGLLIFGITCLHYFSNLLLRKRNLSYHKSIIWFLAFIIIYGTYFCWRFNYYGFIFPNTFYAKTGGGAYQFLRGLEYLEHFILFTKWPVLIGLSLMSLFKPSRSPIIYLLILVIAFSSYVVFIGGDFLGMFRFFVPMLPLIALLVQEGVISLSQWLIKAVHPPFIRKSVITFCFFTFILILAKSLTFSFEGPEYERIVFHRKVTSSHAAIGKWLRKYASPDETLASIAIGAISYYSELNSIDRLGVTDAQVAHTKMSHMGEGMSGHEKRNLGYVLSRKPTYFFGPLIFKEKKFYKPTAREIRKFRELYAPFRMKIRTDIKIASYKLNEK